MNGEQFKTLELDKQVEYINGLLGCGKTVDNIRTDLGIGKNYIGNNFKKGGYAKDKTTGLYILNTCNTSNTNNTTNNGESIQSKKKYIQKVNNIKVLENRIDRLEKQLDQLKAIVLSNNNIEISNTTNTNKIIKYNSKNLVSRNYKIDKNVLEQFVEFCKVNKLKYSHNVSDLITNAIVEYMKNHK